MKVLIWDFDGTLAYRVGGAWTATLVEVLQQELPGCAITLADLRPYTRSGFPWHTPEIPHPPLSSPDAWWGALEETFQRAYRGVGLHDEVAERLSKLVRATYLRPDRWVRFDDVLPTLAALSAQGWTHVLLSNHVPELRDLLVSLELASYFVCVYNSAESGYEKPHPQAFADVLRAFEDAETLWMIGDGYYADVCGAQAVGIPAILVRRPHPEVRHYAESLAEVMAIVGGGMRMG